MTPRQQKKVTPPNAVKSLATWTAARSCREVVAEPRRWSGTGHRGQNLGGLRPRGGRASLPCLAKFIPLFDRLLFLPPHLPRCAVEHSSVSRRSERPRSRRRLACLPA